MTTKKCPTCGSKNTYGSNLTGFCADCGETWHDETRQAWHDLGEAYLEALEELEP